MLAAILFENMSDKSMVSLYLPQRIVRFHACIFTINAGCREKGRKLRALELWTLIGDDLIWIPYVCYYLFHSNAFQTSVKDSPRRNVAAENFVLRSTICNTIMLRILSGPCQLFHWRLNLRSELETMWFVTVSLTNSTGAPNVFKSLAYIRLESVSIRFSDQRTKFFRTGMVEVAVNAFQHWFCKKYFQWPFKKQISKLEYKRYLQFLVLALESEFGKVDNQSKPLHDVKPQQKRDVNWDHVCRYYYEMVTTV